MSRGLKVTTAVRKDRIFREDDWIQIEDWFLKVPDPIDIDFGMEFRVRRWMQNLAHNCDINEYRAPTWQLYHGKKKIRIYCYCSKCGEKVPKKIETMIFLRRNYDRFSYGGIK